MRPKPCLEACSAGANAAVKLGHTDILSAHRQVNGCELEEHSMMGMCKHDLLICHVQLASNSEEQQLASAPVPGSAVFCALSLLASSQTLPAPPL